MIALIVDRGFLNIPFSCFLSRNRFNSAAHHDPFVGTDDVMYFLDHLRAPLLGTALFGLALFFYRRHGSFVIFRLVPVLGRPDAFPPGRQQRAFFPFRVPFRSRTPSGSFTCCVTVPGWDFFR